MTDKKLIGVVLLLVGGVLLYFGYTAAQSLGSQLRETFSGSMSDRAMLYYLGGAVCAGAGMYLVFFSRK